MFCGTAVTIISGAVAERVRFAGYLFLAIFVSLAIYPIFGHWAWGGTLLGGEGGWLGRLGFVDFAGSTVVHSVGGWVSLAACLVIGPRLGRFDGEGGGMRGGSPTLAMLGALMLLLGWFGFNGGSTLGWTDAVPGIIVNTVLAAVAGLLTHMMLDWARDGYPHPNGVINGMLAGLVAITANCHAVSAPAAVAIGVIGALVCVACGRRLERMRVDDVVGAVPVHLAAGVWGTLAVAIFGDPATLGTGLTRWEQLGVQAARRRGVRRAGVPGT